MSFGPQILWLIVVLFVLPACGVGTDSGPAPVISDIELPGESVRGVVPVSFNLADASGYPVQISVSYRTEGRDKWRAASAAAGATDGQGFRSDGTTQARVFLWDSYADIGFNRAEVSLRVAAQNPAAASAAESLAFSVENDNLPPQAAFAPLPDTSSGVVALSVGLADPEDDPVSVELSFSIDGGENYRPATLLDEATDLAATPEGSIHELRWAAGQDLDYVDRDNLRLILLPRDSLGDGVAVVSNHFWLAFEVAAALELPDPASTLRGEAPLAFTLVGNTETLFRVWIGYSDDGGETATACTQLIGPSDNTRNLRAHPEGVDHAFVWDSLADLGKGIVRDLRIVVELLDVEGNAFEPPLVSVSAPFGVDNAPLIDLPVISEVYPGTGVDDGFYELVGSPGYDLTGMRLYEKWSKGGDGLNIGYAVVTLDGQTLNENGLFVLAGTAGPPADLVLDNFDTFFTRGLPMNVILDSEELGFIYDAVGFGDSDTGTWSFVGEGNPAPAPSEGRSLVRELANTDIDDNSLDFIVSDPTPGSARLWNGD